ncbi:MAG: hypothetical protein IKK49_09720 [Clostridia bacterium]|nr:hypothetical protein [Clostridia bacterium]MBR3755352.1 hypothetical protein [Clostridia bacterium]
MKINKLIDTYGRAVEFNTAEATRSCKAFIQPLRYKNKMYLDGVYTQIGFNSQGHYLYIGPPDPDLTLAEESAFISSDGVKYQIDRAERVYSGDKVFYIWAIIRTIVEVE